MEHLEIYTESTPNPEALKFVFSKNLLPNKIADFKTAQEAKGNSELAEKIFEHEYVKSVFISNNFITIKRKENLAWFDITIELKEYLREVVLTDPEAVSEDFVTKMENEKKVFDNAPAESQIVELLDKYVKPAIEMDGGHIEFRSFKDGVVTLALQGSCSGCPSSSITLKSGIESLLKRMVPEVEEVVAEAE